MDEETAAAANVDPDAVVTGDAVDRALDVSRAEAAAQEDTQSGEGGGDRP